MTTARTSTLPPFLDSFPWILAALPRAEAARPHSWEDRDQAEVRQALETLCSWLGPFLPKPEAVAARDLQGEHIRCLSIMMKFQFPAALLTDIRLVISYLTMVGAALKGVTDVEQERASKFASYDAGIAARDA